MGCRSAVRQGVQLTRDVGHMYARGVDFSSSANQSLLATKAGAGIEHHRQLGQCHRGNTGYGVVVLSTFTKIGAQCASCNNTGHVVLMNRVVIGNNTTGFTTLYGNPNSADHSTSVTCPIIRATPRRGRTRLPT